MHALVTGGAGFIGSNLVEALVKGTHRVRVLDNLSTGKRDNLGGLGGEIEIVEGDIRSYHTVREAVEGIDVVFHEAALPSVPRSVRDPISSNAVNVDGTLNILYAAKDAGVKRVMYASSSSVYGDTPELPKHEGMTPNPQSPYAVSKLAAEHYCRVFATLYGLETVALRYFNVFGPKQDPASQYSAVIPKFISAMLSGRSRRSGRTLHTIAHQRGAEHRGQTARCGIAPGGRRPTRRPATSPSSGGTSSTRPSSPPSRRPGRGGAARSS